MCWKPQVHIMDFPTRKCARRTYLLLLMVSFT
jgi:hypothetical protein